MSWNNGLKLYLNIKLIFLDPINIFTSTSCNSKLISISHCANKSVYKNVVNAIISLKLNLNITNEDLRNATEARKLRVNDLSIVLSPKYVKCFNVDLCNINSNV